MPCILLTLFSQLSITLFRLFMALLTLTFAFSAACSSVASSTLPTTVFIISSSFCIAFSASMAASEAALPPLPPAPALPPETEASPPETLPCNFCCNSTASRSFTCPFRVLVSLATLFRSLVICAVSSASLLASSLFFIFSRELLIFAMEVSILLLKSASVSRVEDRF